MKILKLTLEIKTMGYISNKDALKAIDKALNSIEEFRDVLIYDHEYDLPDEPPKQDSLGVFSALSLTQGPNQE